MVGGVLASTLVAILASRWMFTRAPDDDPGFPRATSARQILLVALWFGFATGRCSLSSWGCFSPRF